MAIKTPFWFEEVFGEKTKVGIKVKEILFQGKSEFQKIEIFDTEAYGRLLAIDGMLMTSEKDEHFYHEMLVHPALTTAPKIERILVIGGGDGGTVREVLSYREVKHVHMVEIDPMVVEASKRYLPSIGTAWNDPRLRVDFADAIKYVSGENIEPYDVILLDGSDPVGPAEGLFSNKFYADCARLLKNHGVFALQSESPVTMEKTFRDAVHTLKKVFPNVHPYFGPVPIYACGAWSWTYASLETNPFAFNEERMVCQEARCKRYNRDIHRGAFAVPNDLK